jgi:hypothetical protein
VHYLITGGGGAPLYDVDKPPEGITQKVISTEHFVSVKVTGKTSMPWRWMTQSWTVST